MSNPLIVVVGAGPGIGSAVARRFGRAGYDVALIARSADKLEALGSRLQANGITAGWTPVDITDDEALRSAVTRFGDHAGHLDVLHFNPSATTVKSPLELTAAELLADLRLGVVSLLGAVQAARPFMRSGARILATGSMSADQPWSAAAGVGVQKAALRNLVKAVDAELKSDGIRAMSLTVKGTLAAGTPFTPDLVAQALYTAATTPDEDWRTEVPYNG